MDHLVKKKRRRGAKRRLTVFLILAGLLVVFSILAPLLTPNDPNATSAADMNAATLSCFIKRIPFQCQYNISDGERRDCDYDAFRFHSDIFTILRLQDR